MTRWTLLAGVVLAAGCAPSPQRPVMVPVPVEVEEPARTASPPGPMDDRLSPKAVVVWTPVSGEDLLLTAEFLEAHESVHVTAVLPEYLFKDDENTWRAWQILSKLVLERRLDVVLSLPNNPPLPLLQDTDLAKLTASSNIVLPARYTWPEDVAGQLAESISRYRKRWRRGPSGLVAPGGLVVGPETLEMRKFKLDWVILLEGKGQAGYFGGLPIGIVRPAVYAASTQKGMPGERLLIPAGGVSEESPFPPPLRVSTFLELTTFWESKASSASWKLISEIYSSRPRWPVWPGLEEEAPDFSPWIGEGEENAAWRLLGMTRRAVEDYKNSGQAHMRNLDLALQEIYHAENGRFFYYFGNDFDSGKDFDLQREFLATLAQVHRLIGQPVPSYLNESFGAEMTGSTAPQAEGSLFQKLQNGFRWVDTAKDDRGPGDYFYPTNADLIPGMWDLSSYEVRVYQDSVVFQFNMAALGNPWKGPFGFSGLLIDVYIDINRISGAGYDKLLPRRPGIVETQDGWEYALSVDGWGSRLYRYSPATSFKVLSQPPVKLIEKNSIRVEVPRSLFRGEPDQWGYGVVVMGHDPGLSSKSPEDASVPMPVFPEPGERNFGGAWQGTAHESSRRPGPPFIDILVPFGQTQSNVLGVYKQGREIVIPLVRPEP